METFLSYAKALAPVFMAVAAALAPTYGKYAWFTAVVAGAGALALVAPTVLPPRANKSGQS